MRKTAHFFLSNQVEVPEDKVCVYGLTDWQHWVDAATPVRATAIWKSTFRVRYDLLMVLRDANEG